MNKDEILNKCKRDGTLPGLAFSNIPIPVFEWFMSDIDTNYNNTYWVKLLMLMQKAEAYDMLTQGMVVEEPNMQVQTDQPKDEKKITLGA